MPAPGGNTYNKKWPTSEERMAACEAFCAHIRQGLSMDCFPLASAPTIRSYVKTYPEDFCPEKIGVAAREGLKAWEELGLKGAKGEIPGFNATSWIFNMKNRAGWKDRTEVEAWGILGGPDDVKKIERLKPRSTSEIALGVMALLTKLDRDESETGSAEA